MNIACDLCNGKHKGRYTSFLSDGKVVTLCNDCRFGPKPTKSNKEVFDSLQIPFWRLMGQKPKPHELAYEKYLKSRGMTYGDAVMERSAGGKEKSAYEKFVKESKKS